MPGALQASGFRQVLPQFKPAEMRPKFAETLPEPEDHIQWFAHALKPHLFEEPVETDRPVRQDRSVG